MTPVIEQLDLIMKSAATIETLDGMIWGWFRLWIVTDVMPDIRQRLECTGPATN